MSVNWYLGKGNFRDSYIVPVLRFLGCKNVPNVNLEEDKSQKFLIVNTNYQENETSKTKEELPVPAKAAPTYPQRQLARLGV